MFRMKLSKEYRVCYEGSRYRDRIDSLVGQLSMMGYPRMRICEMVRVWLRFAKYCDDAGMDVPSSIHEEEVQRYLVERIQARCFRRCVRIALRIFIEADDSGNFSRRVHALPKPATQIFNEWGIPYLHFLREHRGLKETTLRVNTLTLRKFTEFLDKNGICDIKNVDVGLVHDFCRNPGNCKPTTWVLRMSHLRCFLRFVFSRKGLERDLSLAVAAVKHFRHAGLPDVLTGAEVDKILGCVDRSNGRRKRDFVILLLAACYGMRPSDILRLRLDDIHWRERSIVYCQSKTGKPITLPLLPEISEALIDYLRSWRPPTKSRCIFVRHKVPFEPFASKDPLYWIMPEALRRAGIFKRPGSRGLYLFRHTLAARLLGAHVSIKTIGDILGHASAQSTFVYTKVDVSALRSASLSITEVLQ